jgi:C4-dicarboxylate transporter DctM subunit
MVFGLISLVVLLALIFGGLWLGSAIGLAAFASGSLSVGLASIVHMVGFTTWTWSNSFTLAAIPLFLFMGELILQSGLMTRVWNSLESLMVAGVPGGLLHPLIFTCAVFGACCGSGAAATALFCRTCYPALVTQRGYSSPMTAGVICAGGNLSILIPPSIIFILLGGVTQVSVGSLFIAGIIPGILCGLLFMVYVAFRAIRNPGLAPQKVAGSSHPRIPVWRAVVNIMPLFILILLVLGMIYLGVTTPTEAAALGAVGAAVIALVYRELNLRSLIEAARNAILMTCMIYFLVFAAMTFTIVLTFCNIPNILQAWAIQVQNPLILFIFVCIMYLVLGCFCDPISMMLVTIPFVFPCLQTAGFDPIFICIIVTMFVAIALLTPPIGGSLFIVHGASKAPFGEVIRGSAPFVVLFVVVVVLIYLFPQLATWLPSTMK